MRSADPPSSSNPALPPQPQPGFARRAAEALEKAVWRSDAATEPHNGVATVATLTERVKKYLPSAEVQKVKDAFRFSDEAHLGQFRRSGAPYITHPRSIRLASARTGRRRTCYRNFDFWRSSRYWSHRSPSTHRWNCCGWQPSTALPLWASPDGPDRWNRGSAPT